MFNSLFFSIMFYAALRVYGIHEYINFFLIHDILYKYNNL